MMRFSNALHKHSYSFFIRRLDDEYKNGMLSLAEEKSCIKQMEELKRSLPFAEPLEEIQKEIKRQRDHKKKYGSESYELYQKLQLVKE